MRLIQKCQQKNVKTIIKNALSSTDPAYWHLKTMQGI